MQPEKTTLETVQQDLVDLVSRYGTLNAELPECAFSTPTKELDPRGFRFPRMTTENATPSAVLILFGALDDVPADYRSETVPSSLDVLLTQRAVTLRKHPGQISFPGGQRDPADADDTACALREASEETGLDPSSVTVLGQLPTVGLPVTNFSVTPVIGWWSTPGSVDVVDDHEATRVFSRPRRRSDRPRSPSLGADDLTADRRTSPPGHARIPRGRHAGVGVYRLAHRPHPGSSGMDASLGSGPVRRRHRVGRDATRPENFYLPRAPV